MADYLKASEALVAMPLPEMIKGLGFAVAAANKELSAQDAGNGHVLTVHSAVIEINVAISVNTAEEFKVGGSLGINVFSLNASYAKIIQLQRGSLKQNPSGAERQTQIALRRNRRGFCHG